MDANWFDLWMKQSKEFFDSAETNLKDLFNKSANPEDHLDQIKQWQDMLKNQWQFMELNPQQKEHEEYWQVMIKMCNEAFDMMVEQWIRRNREGKPIMDVRELYELWLSCCNDVYAKHMRTRSYQQMYGDFMNAALNYWKTSMPK